ncbi:MAG: hypothetical protein JXQ75_14460 [Phycisphaerae bacterium]|nr:hypothetical protein [Phycisphaerae bacterium]
MEATVVTRIADPKAHWTRQLAAFLPEFMEQHPVLSAFHPPASVVFYGSTTTGIDDDLSDLDVWLLLPDAGLAELDAASETRFFEFKLNGKAGHLTAHDVQQFSAKLRHCEMDTIRHLRSAVAMTDPAQTAGNLIRLARKPMRQEVSDAFFFHHYVEMRSEHRACDNPIERGDPVALLLSMTKTIAHALRAAMVLDGQPYPYDKWLLRAAMQTPTGRLLAHRIERILDHLGQGQLRVSGPGREHPIGQELRNVRQILIEAAHAKGNHAPWLEKWYLHMDQARDAIVEIEW